jgi:hypothetical protein
MLVISKVVEQQQTSAQGDGDVSFVQAISRKAVRVFNPERKDHHRGRRNLARNE